MEDKICKNCKFWEDQSWQGTCRRNSPQFLPIDGGISGEIKKDRYSSEDDPKYSISLSTSQYGDFNRGQWPTTSPDDWCGEFKKKVTNGLEKAAERATERIT